MKKIPMIFLLHMPVGRRMRVVIKHPKAVLKWGISNPKRLIKARLIISKLTGNTDFPVPYPDDVVALATLVTDTGIYDTKIVIAKTRVSGSSEAMQVAQNTVHLDLESIMSMVQRKMDANPDRALQICANAGFDSKLEGNRGKRKAGCEKDTEPGTMIIYGEGEGQHDWQESINAGETFYFLASTTGGIKHVDNLISKKRYWWRSRRVYPNEKYGDWTEWVSEEAS
ncbi:MAG: hypothetical protein WCH34_10840 [Bacteroidota bacterium]